MADATAPEGEQPPVREQPPAGSKVEPTDLSIALTPRQILGGFALLATLVMLLRRRKPRS
jgi:hypothetical protein